MSTNEPILYYHGNAGGVNCHITSKIWQFESHSIPVHAVSDIVATQTTNIVGIIICIVISIVSLILGTVYQLPIIFGLSVFSIIILVILICGCKKELVVCSNGGMKEKITFSTGSFAEADKLYSALLECIDDGNNQ